MELNLPTGIPMGYELNKNLKPIKPMQFLGGEETVRKAMEAGAAQGRSISQPGFLQRGNTLQTAGVPPFILPVYGMGAAIPSFDEQCILKHCLIK